MAYNLKTEYDNLKDLVIIGPIIMPGLSTYFFHPVVSLALYCCFLAIYYKNEFWKACRCKIKYFEEYSLILCSLLTVLSIADYFKSDAGFDVALAILSVFGFIIGFLVVFKDVSNVVPEEDSLKRMK